jgi:hypothetical protein
MKLDEVVNQSSVPAVLYHYTSRDNRDSIMRHGLLADKSHTGGPEIYLASKLTNETQSDVWEVDARGLDIHPDFQVPEDNSDDWWVTYDDITPNRLKLVSESL